MIVGTLFVNELFHSASFGCHGGKAHETVAAVDGEIGHDGTELMGGIQFRISAEVLPCALIDEEGKLAYTNRLEEYERIFGFHAEVRDYIPSGKISIVEAD
ncbi:MAG: hypothetical protein II339_01840 [Spirochaetales bacterium]|nr:hypothetical protein [Spirochaetales bacterium]